MSLSGKLQDLGVADVLQFIHMGRRTGTLAVHCLGESGSIVFHRGRIVAAHAPDSAPLGEMLVLQGSLASEDLRSVLARQKTISPRRPLGKMLLEEGTVPIEALHEAVTQQIHEAVGTLVRWKKGTFEFVPDEIHPIDDLELFPGEVLPHLNLDSQGVLLEAMRLIDESAAAAPTAEEESSSVDPFDAWTRGTAGPKTRDNPTPRLQVIARDPELLAQLRSALPELSDRLVVVEIREAGVPGPGEPPPILLVDLRPGSRVDLSDLSALGVRRPRASIIAFVDETQSTAPIYCAGALSVVPVGRDAIAACLSSVIRNRGDLWAPQVVAEQVRAGYAKLRRVYSDLRSGLLSTTLALNLMSIIAESVDRAVLFLVRDQKLVGLGAFGEGPGGRLAQCINNLTLPLSQAGALTESIETGTSRILSYDEARLPSVFDSLLGRPCSGQCAVFPVLGAKKMIAIIYADNGRRAEAIDEVDVLELATAQLGVAFENELLRRQLSSTQRVATAPNHEEGRAAR